MRTTGRNGMAILLIVIGALILLNKVSFGIGPLMGYLVPVAMIGFGYIGIKNDKKFVGWSLLVLGTMILLAKLSGLIGIAIAIGLIAYGVSLFKRSNAYE